MVLVTDGGEASGVADMLLLVGVEGCVVLCSVELGQLAVRSTASVSFASLKKDTEKCCKALNIFPKVSHLHQRKRTPKNIVKL